VVLGKVLLGRPQRLVVAAQRAAAVAADEAGSVQARGGVALALQHGQAHQRLHAAHEGAAFAERVFVVERSLFEGFADVVWQGGVHDDVSDMVWAGALLLLARNIPRKQSCGSASNGRSGEKCRAMAPIILCVFCLNLAMLRKNLAPLEPALETLDKFDLAILMELQADARLTNAELAQRVGLSAAPCWRRVRALEEAGFIRGYRAEIDRHKIGLGVLAFVRLDAERNTGDLTRAMEEAIRRIPEVVSCHYISGTGTFELQVVAPDLERFSQFAREVLLNLPNVKDMHTSFSLGEVKAGGALPLGHLGRNKAHA
jgi:Transcriptional regulators